MTVAGAVASFQDRQNGAVFEVLYKVVLEAVAQRAALRSVKRWSEADVIRDRLTALGIEVKEDKIGTLWRVTDGPWWAGGYIITDLKILVEQERPHDND